MQDMQEQEQNPNPPPVVTPITSVVATKQTKQKTVDRANLEAAIEQGASGDAELLRALLRHRFCFGAASKHWYRWAGTHWKQDVQSERLCVAHDELVALYSALLQDVDAEKHDALAEGNKDSANAKKAFASKIEKRLVRLHDPRYQTQVVDHAAVGLASLSVEDSETFDKVPHYLPCLNDTVDLKTGFPLANRPDAWQTKCAPVKYDRTATAPTWHTFMNDIFDGDAELVAFVRRLLGMALLGEVSEHVLPIFYGGGANGKSALLETIKQTIGGDFATPGNLSIIVGKADNRGGPSPELLRLRGTRLVWFSEPDGSAHLRTGNAKNLTGGDTLTARPLHGNPVEWSPTHTAIVTTNHKPRVPDNDFGTWRRILLVPFNVRFVDNPSAANERQRDPRMIEKLRTERPGILADLVEGCLEFQRDGLNPPDAVRVETALYQNEEDDVKRFVEECCKLDSSKKVAPRKFHDAYATWCQGEGILHPLASKKLQKRLETAFGIRRGKSREIPGIYLDEKG